MPDFIPSKPFKIGNKTYKSCKEFRAFCKSIMKRGFGTKIEKGTEEFNVLTVLLMLNYYHHVAKVNYYRIETSDALNNCMLGVIGNKYFHFGFRKSLNSFTYDKIKYIMETKGVNQTEELYLYDLDEKKIEDKNEWNLTKRMERELS